MKDEMASLLDYRPDRAAVKERMIREAKQIYQAGLTHTRHQPVLNSYEGMLRKFYLYPTFNCPLRCPYCYAEGGERKVPELPGKDLLRITQEAIDAGYQAVILVGGEPLVYHDFPGYLDGLAGLLKRNCRYVLRTSFAFPVADKMMDKLCAVFDEIVVSLDGDEEMNDAVRGKGSWRRATENVKKAMERGGRISIAAVMTREQGEGPAGESLRVFCRSLGIEKLVINSPVPMGRARDSHVPYYEWRSDPHESDSVKMHYSCGLGHSLYVQPDGSVYPCYAWCEKEHQLGDLSKESLQDILDRKELLSILNSGVDTNRKCRTCDVRYFCGGRCKIWVSDHADIDSGDFDCTETRQSILETLQRYGIIPVREGKENVLQNL